MDQAEEEWAEEGEGAVSTTAKLVILLPSQCSVHLGGVKPCAIGLKQVLREHIPCGGAGSLATPRGQSVRLPPTHVYLCELNHILANQRQQYQQYELKL